MRPSSHRWLRIDAAWDESEWLLPLSPAARLAWVRLLCDAKIYGVRGRQRRWKPTVLAHRWRLPVDDISAMIKAAVDDGAVALSDDEYIVVNWSEYQEIDTTATERQRRKRLRDNDINHSHGVTAVTGVTHRDLRRDPSRDGDVDGDGDVVRSAVPSPSVVSEAAPSDNQAGKKSPGLPPECQGILDHWLAYAPLPASSKTPSGLYRCLDTFRLMNSVDGLGWPEIARITKYAAEVWQPAGYIGSPASLRSWTAKKDRRVWEAIQAQLNGKANGRPSEFTPDYYTPYKRESK